MVNVRPIKVIPSMKCVSPYRFWLTIPSQEKPSTACIHWKKRSHDISFKGHEVILWT